MTNSKSLRLNFPPSQEAEQRTLEYAKYCGYKAYATGVNPRHLTALGRAYYNIADRLDQKALKEIARS